MKSTVGLWGKLRREGDSVVEWHPLVDHLIDVASVTEALLTHTLLGDRLSSLGDTDLDDPILRARLVVLAALHDLGKFNRGFQNKAHPGKLTAGHVSEALYGFQNVAELRERLAFLADWGEALPLLLASISHHGSPVQQRTSALAFWDEAALRALSDFVEELPRLYPDAFRTGPALPATPKFVHGFAGLVMLADWLGSDTRFFPYTEATDGPRLAFARERARLALREIGMQSTHARSVLESPCPFDRVAPFTPNAMQAAVHALPTEHGASLTFLESETGSGKTEAAFARFLQLFAAGEVDGMYFALPTRSAASQLHHRATEFAQRAFGDAAPPVILAVPGYLQVDDRTGHRLPGFEVLWNDDPRDRFRFRGWAVEHPKRYLAGALVVGTIDQVLLAGLQTSHTHLRGTSLLRQLLVVDEVHASDAYMNRLLEQVLRHHFAAGGHALLMSATLGSAARIKLQNVLSKTPAVPLSDAMEVPYPRVSLVMNRGESETPPIAAVDTKSHDKEVHWKVASIGDDPTQVAKLAVLAARQDARVLVIRNTVRDCIATLAEVQALDPERTFRCAGVVAPHHGRFAKPDRRALDEAIESTFGKGSSAHGVVAVATQTVEQSLDIDADLLLTDLCPMDVLLQRVGRLHRHRRERPQGFERAQVHVLTPEERDLARLLKPSGEASGTQGFGTVYQDLRILEATWCQIEERPRVHIPMDNRALVGNATHPEALARTVTGDVWKAHTRWLTGSRLMEQQLGKINAIDWCADFTTPFPTDRKMPTRLGLADRRVVLTEPARGPFGENIRELKVPGWMVRDLELDDDLKVAVDATDDAFRFALGEAVFRYSRLGLEKE